MDIPIYPLINNNLLFYERGSASRDVVGVLMSLFYSIFKGIPF